ncbi:MAG: hypothetical protein GC204_19625 [Chloroflexi bacterium]|nr:hypothetical protein [Chloroflexota bacterium]
MLKRFLIAATLLLAACQSAGQPRTSAITPPPPRSEVTTPKWLETQMNGVSLGLWQPVGWEADSSRGLVVAEPTVSNNGLMAGGLLIYCFVPPTDEFHIGSGDSNNAWTVLNQVVKMPSHIGHDVAVSQPVGFDWGAYPAAYYLLTSGDGMRVFVIAMAVPNVRKIVVCNLSIPAAQASRLRESLPHLLDGLTINSVVFSGKSLDNLPDPLPFPRYTLTSTPVDDRISAASTP